MILDTDDAEKVERFQQLEHAAKEMNLLRQQVAAARKLKAHQQDEALERLGQRFNDPDKPTFVWQLDFAEVFHRQAGPVSSLGLDLDAPSAEDDKSPTPGGFDIVLANPPYVRMELIKPLKPDLRRNFP